MERFACTCGAELFFENTSCSACGATVGWCDACDTLVSAASAEGPGLRCSSCGGGVTPCANRERLALCNGLVMAEAPAGWLCRRCGWTTLGPNASDEANLVRWRRLERAKRRLLYDLASLGIGDEFLHGAPPLSFRFPADTPDERFLTGHADGVITVRLDEADPVRRESLRVELGEPQRTLVGHLRHEVSHYLWRRLVEGDGQGERMRAAVGLVGDPSLDYAGALQRYYQDGPPVDWQERFISPYASSHPWEDFAETAAFYMDLHAMMHVVAAQGSRLLAEPGGSAPPYSAATPLSELLPRHLAAGLFFNEVNRAVGLTDAVPEVISPAVAEKLAFVDSLVAAARS